MNQCGHPTALVSSVTVSCENSPPEGKKKKFKFSPRLFAMHPQIAFSFYLGFLVPYEEGKPPKHRAKNVDLLSVFTYFYFNVKLL